MSVFLQPYGQHGYIRRIDTRDAGGRTDGAGFLRGQFLSGLQAQCIDGEIVDILGQQQLLSRACLVDHVLLLDQISCIFQRKTDLLDGMGGMILQLR